MAEVSASVASSAPQPTVTQTIPTDPTKTAGARQVSAPFQISSVQSRDRWFKGLFYGAHGAGKTELAASAVDVPQMGDVLLVDAESGDSTVYDSDRIKNWDQIEHIKVSNFNTVARIQEFLKAHCAARDDGDKAKLQRLWDMVRDPDNPRETSPIFKTVIIDSLTEVEAYCTYQILKMDIDKIPNEDQMDVAGWPEFRKNNEMVKLLVRAFRDLEMNVIFLCAQGYTQDERKKFHYGPLLTGKLGGQVQGFVDMVGYIVVGQADNETGTAPRRVYVQPVDVGGARFDAKNRRPQFKGAFFDNPTMMDIMRETRLLKS
jgi:hypothetical protein